MRREGPCILDHLILDAYTSTSEFCGRNGWGNITFFLQKTHYCVILCSTWAFAVFYSKICFTIQRSALFWDITQRRVVINCLPTFRDKVAVPSSRVKSPETSVKQITTRRSVIYQKSADLIKLTRGGSLKSRIVLLSFEILSQIYLVLLFL
jgi:hypothetical protein